MKNICTVLERIPGAEGDCPRNEHRWKVQFLNAGIPSSLKRIRLWSPGRQSSLLSCLGWELVDGPWENWRHPYGMPRKVMEVGVAWIIHTHPAGRWERQSLLQAVSLHHLCWQILKNKLQRKTIKTVQIHFNTTGRGWRGWWGRRFGAERVYIDYFHSYI